MFEQYIVWSKPNCPQCDKAKALLKSKGIEFVEKRIGETVSVDDLLALVPGARSVPQVFIGNTYVGGYSELLHKVE